MQLYCRIRKSLLHILRRVLFDVHPRDADPLRRSALLDLQPAPAPAALRTARSDSPSADRDKNNSSARIATVPAPQSSPAQPASPVPSPCDSAPAARPASRDTPDKYCIRRIAKSRRASQNAFVSVASCACTSSPITASYRALTSGGTRPAASVVFAMADRKIIASALIPGPYPLPTPRASEAALKCGDPSRCSFSVPKTGSIIPLRLVEPPPGRRAQPPPHGFSPRTTHARRSCYPLALFHLPFQHRVRQKYNSTPRVSIVSTFSLNKILRRPALSVDAARSFARLPLPAAPRSGAIMRRLRHPRGHNQPVSLVTMCLGRVKHTNR